MSDHDQVEVEAPLAKLEQLARLRRQNAELQELLDARQGEQETEGERR